jgi:hypothetical protein
MTTNRRSQLRQEEGMDVPPSTLTLMSRTGKEISALFANSMTEDDKSRIATQLLVLMRTTELGGDAHSARLMLLGALAAVGREAQPSN